MAVWCLGVVSIGLGESSAPQPGAARPRYALRYALQLHSLEGQSLVSWPQASGS